MTKQSRKGNKGEREVEEIFAEFGYVAVQRGGAGREDIRVVDGPFQKGEVKQLAAWPPEWVYNELEKHGADFLCVRRVSSQAVGRPALLISRMDCVLREIRKRDDEIAALRAELSSLLPAQMRDLERRVARLEGNGDGDKDAD